MKRKSIPKNVFIEETAKLLKENHSVTFVVKGNSMNPFIAGDRDKVVIASHKEEKMKRGTLVLACDTNGIYVMHRIIDRKGNLLTLMGDGNLNITEQAYTDSVFGKVISIIRKNKEFSCEGYTWKIYSAFWMKALPLRRYLLAICRRINII